VQDAVATPRGVLRVNVPHLFATHFLAPHIAGFLAANPAVRVVLDVAPVPVGVTAVETDVVIRVGPLEDSALLARRLGVSEVRLYATPAALGALTPGEALALIRAAGLEEDAPLGQLRTVVGFEEGRAIQRIEALEPLVRHGIVMAGAGAGWLPAFLCRAEVARGRLLDLTPGAPRGPIAIHALFTPEAATTPKVRAFLDFLKRTMDVLEAGKDATTDGTGDTPAKGGRRMS
jgi:DNA-binding transcriptional LysR family regulator